MRRLILTLGLTAVVAIVVPWICAGEVPPLPAPAVAAAPAPALPAGVRVDVQMVSVSLAEARDLVPALQSRKTADAAWTRVQAMIGRDEAKLLAWPVLWLQNGGHGSAKSVEEIRYATEFTPPQVPTTFGPVPLVSPTWGPSVPTAYETRNLGCTFDAEATVEQGGQVVALNLVSQFDRLAGFREWHAQRSPFGIVGVQQQPDFQTAKINTSFRVHRDQPALVGVFVLAEPEPHVELHILHARVTSLPPGAALPPPK